jgi:outer membrane protein OmpA-like peptidoglycan-associated protein
MGPRFTALLAMLGILASAVAHAQSASILELRSPVEEIAGQVFELTLPGGSTVATSGEIGVRETASEIRVELAADILFDFDRAEIRPSAAQALHQAGELIRARAKGPVRVEGHTDGKGGTGYNQRLSERRANAVRLWLVQEESLESFIFVTAGYGANRPVVSNTRPDGSDDPVGRQRNRRVELVLQKR